MKEVIGIAGFFSILCVIIFIVAKVATATDQSMIIIGLIFIVICVWLLIKFVRMFMENVGEEAPPESDWI